MKRCLDAMPLILLNDLLNATSKWFWARLQQEARPRPYQLHHLPLCLGLVSSRMIKFALETPKISRQCVNNPRS